MALTGMAVGASCPPSLQLSETKVAELLQVLLSFGWTVKG
jgi:hypothetical protein